MKISAKYFCLSRLDTILAEEIQNFKNENAQYILKTIKKNNRITFANAKTNEKRNNWAAKVILTPGSGKIYVNGEDQDSNKLDQAKKFAWRPLAVTNAVNKYDVNLLIPKEIDLMKNESVIRKAILKVLSQEFTLRQKPRRAGLISRAPQKYTIIMESGRCKIRREPLKAKLDKETLKK